MPSGRTEPTARAASCSDSRSTISAATCSGGAHRVRSGQDGATPMSRTGRRSACANGANDAS
ncbi:hypothetical protein ACFQX6_02640 [Streptosporangium lutulentum]